MKRIISTVVSLLFVLVTSSGCVSRAEFNKFKAKAELTDRILLCESAVDAYQDLIGSDEPNPTRRDEPSGTRRDEFCQDEYNSLTQGNADVCATNNNGCMDGSTYSNQECRVCETVCLNTSSWPTTGSPSCPPPF